MLNGVREVSLRIITEDGSNDIDDPEEAALGKVYILNLVVLLRQDKAALAMFQEVNGSDLIVFSADRRILRAQLWLQHWTDPRDESVRARFEEVYPVPCIAVDINGRVNLQVLRQFVQERVDVFEVTVEFVAERLFQLGIQRHRETEFAPNSVEDQQLLLESNILGLHLIHRLANQRDHIRETDLAANHDQNSKHLLR